MITSTDSPVINVKPKNTYALPAYYLFLHNRRPNKLCIYSFRIFEYIATENGIALY